MKHWHPLSWQDKPNNQAIPYPCRASLDTIVTQLSEYAPLVKKNDVLQLKQKIARASDGEGFILQAGACAERFIDSTPTRIASKLNLLNALSQTLEAGLGKKVTCIGRLAGQYAKPRTSPLETREMQSLLSYRGDLINSPVFKPQSRIPDPIRLLQSYHYASSTLEHLSQIKHKTVCYTSHEALALFYDQALTRQDEDGNWYNMSTHFPWLGMRTGDLQGAFVDYLRGISNPIGIKIGPDATTEWLTELLSLLNPDNERGRISLITRLGCAKLNEKLPLLIESIKTSGQSVLWMCDPMHGNTVTTIEGIKTRYFHSIYQELTESFRIHQRFRTHLSGLHLEITSVPVQECIDEDRENLLQTQYPYKPSLVDPRLNSKQATKLIKLLVDFVNSSERGIFAKQAMEYMPLADEFSDF